MRKIACKAVSREIDELERGQEPGAMTRVHLQECISCSDFYADRLKLRQMIGGLEAVKAPGDFDFRLRARLANERSKSASRFSTGAFGFGLPSVALGLIAILVGGGLFIRMTKDSPTQPSTVAQSDTPRVSEPNTVATKVAPEALELKASETNDKAVNSGQPTVLVKDRRNRKGSRTTSSAVVRDNFLARSESAAVFPLEAAEPLRVSIDYATGGSRTISLPAVSFGSQQVVAQGASMMKTSARTVW